MIKHIGRHSDKKIVVLYRQVPGEDHMCLVVYSDLLPRIYHDSVMTVLESAVGQQAESLADAIFRSMMPDGINALEALHKNGLIKKINTNQVIMTPTPSNTVRLDELNEILNEMQKGEAAIKRLAEMDNSLGLGKGKRRPAEPREVGVPPSSRTQPAEQTTNFEGVLSDADLARSRIAQAEMMKKNAATMLAEADRLLQEAVNLDPTTTTTKTNVGTAKKKTVKVKAT